MSFPGEYDETRAALHRVAAHVLGRRRFEVSGRFGLRATPGGFGTPAYGDPVEVLRIAGPTLVRENGGEASYVDIDGASLRTLAAFVGTDIGRDFDCGVDAPPVGDVDAKLRVSTAAVDVIAGWFALGSRAVDVVIAELPEACAPATLQIWPEHFDAGTNVAVAPDVRVNLGASPGDAFSASPYIYVGPWSDERPGDPAYWNAPFGAALAYEELSGDPLEAVVTFLRRGVELMREAT